MKYLLLILLMAGSVSAQTFTRSLAFMGNANPRSSGFATYDAAVLSGFPIAYYPQRETNGTTATNWSGAVGRNGTYTSVTLSNTTWVNGDFAPLYNSAGNKMVFASTGFNTNFSGDTGHLSLWIKPTNTAWADGTARTIGAIITDAGASLQVIKHSTANTIRVYRVASATTVDLQFTTRATGWLNIQVIWKTNEFVKFYYEGVLVGEDTTGIGAWTGNISIGQVGTYSAVFQGNIGPVAVFNSTNTSAFVTTLATVPNRLTNMMNHVICDGDSLTAGGQSGATPYPTQLQDLLGTGIWDMRNFGVSGQTTTNMLSDVTTQVDVWHNAIRPREVVVCLAGSNDIFSGGNAANLQTGISNYCSGRRLAGFDVLVCSILPRSGYNGTQEAIRVAVNSWVASNYASFADGFVNLAADTRLDDYTDATYYNADQTHLTTAGYGVVAELVEAVINP
jgi:lysophospholipase L1-like esterase